MLVKNGSESSVTVTIEGDDSTVLADTVVTQSDLTDADLDDHFELYSISNLNTANNSEVTIKIAFVAQTILGDTTVDADGKLASDVQKANELRVDNVEFSTDGAPTDGTEAYFDSFRLVSHESIVE